MVPFGRFSFVVLELRRMCALMWCVLVCTEIDGSRTNASGLLTMSFFSAGRRSGFADDWLFDNLRNLATL